METKSQKSPIISQQLVTSESKVKIFLAVFGLIVLIEIIVAVVVLPNLLTTIGKKRDENAADLLEIKELQDQTQILDGLNSKKVSSDLNNAAFALPTEKKVSGIVSSLTTLASSSGIVVNQLELTPCKISTRSGTTRISTVRTTDCQNVKLENGINGINLSMEILATSAQLEDFANKLYTASPMLGVETFDYSRNLKREVTNLGILLYYQPSLTSTTVSEKLVNISSNEEDILKSLSGQTVILP